MESPVPCVNCESVSAIFFDLDNTLIQTRKADKKACDKLEDILIGQYGMLSKSATTSTSVFLRAFRKCPENPECDLDLWRIHLWREALPTEYAHIAEDIFEQWIELRYHYLSIGTDVRHLLQSLREQYHLGLITNGSSRAQWEKVERLQLRDLFDCILVSGDLPWEKPRPEIFQEACNKLGVAPAECIMVGDKLETDIQGGKEAELGGTVWVPLTSEDVDKADGKLAPDYTINSVTDLPELLPSHIGAPQQGNDARAL